MRKIILLLAALSGMSVYVSHAQEWAPVGDNIKTEWADDVNPSCPLPEYPRPQMVRSEWQNLNGLWDYAVTSAEAADFSAEGKILVPFALESSLSGVGGKMTKENALWYERTFTIPSKWRKNDILLHFGAVDWKSEIWVNGQYAGEHRGGYDPFCFDITPYLKKSGKQTLRVKVQDATDNGFQPRGKQCLIADGIWYTPVSGIWQTVWLEPVPNSRVESYSVQGNLKESTVSVDVEAILQDGDKVMVTLLEGGEGYSPEQPSEKVIAEAEVHDGKALLHVPQMKAWSPDSPYLYGLDLRVERGGKVIDLVHGYASMREISVYQEPKPYKYKRITLNGEPLFQFGPLDQGWWPDGLYTAPTEEALKFDIQKTREMGFNMIRKHIKVEPARWYYWCDVMGMLVWQDMPNIGDYFEVQFPARDPEVVEAQNNVWAHGHLLGGTDCVVPQGWKDNFYAEWAAIMKSLKGFQCIVMWVPFNEGWGQFDTEAVVQFTREQDPTRLVNEASGGNFVLTGDIIDVHTYPNPYMKFFERNFINVIGEYGGIGYPVEGHLWKIENKWGYGEVEKDAEGLMKRYEKCLEQLEILVKNGYSAAIYTQTTDVEGEVNGLMTYDRAVIKVDLPRIFEANQALIHSMNQK